MSAFLSSFLRLLGLSAAKPIDDNPPQRIGCGACRWCVTKHPFGCPHSADQSDIDAVMAMVE
ncbi:MAG TPA: hypothetical protein VF747_03480 [Blastocatellia bacterium]|jgi:hypothetical protein